MKRTGKLAVDLIFLLMITVIGMALVEGTLRIVQGNGRPEIPAIIDRLGAPRLQTMLDLPVRLPRYPAMQLVTDGSGARVARAAARDADRTGGILFVGDSQLLGWALPFEQTAASNMARMIGVPQDKVAILAAPAEDPEKEIGWARDYTLRRGERQRVEVVGLNLGNDLEEIYLTRVGTLFPSRSGFRAWLSRHSVAYIDLAVLYASAWGQKGEPHPEVNSAMLWLTEDERMLLAEQAAASVERLLAALPPAERRIVAVVPQDSQVRLDQFDKYRPYYPDEADFWAHKQAQEVALDRLEIVQQAIVDRLRSRGISVVVAEPALDHAWGRPELIDTRSHHLMKAGQEVLARALAPTTNGAR